MPKRSHGKSQTVEYKIWKGIRKRCLNKNSPRYKDYGARGIGICENWSNFENFLTDMGSRPSPEHSIDRIDNDRGYSKENCRWATHLQQGRNSRKVVMLTYKDKTLCLTEWAEKIGVGCKCLRSRLDMGWSIGEALGYEKRTIEPGLQLTCNGETHSLATWARLTGLPYRRLKARRKHGWSLERTLGFE